MVKLCQRCGDPMPPGKRAHAKFCGEKCRNRNVKGASIRPIKSAKAVAVVAGVHAAALAELVAAGRESTSRGQAALRLAERLDSGTADTGSAVAAVAREFNAAMVLALEGAAKANDPLDELAERRLRRVTGA